VRMYRRHFAALIVFLSAPAAMAQSGHHHHHASHVATPASSPAGAPDGVSVQDCWIRNMPASLPSGGYFLIRNDSAQAVELTGVSSSAYGATMLHQTQTQNGMARMVHVDSVKVPAKGELAFRPGSYHAMLEQPTGTLTVGESVPVSFLFQGGGQIDAQCVLRPAAAT